MRRADRAATSRGVTGRTRLTGVRNVAGVACALVATAATPGCDTGIEGVSRPEPAVAFVKDFVAIGDGFTAGVQSGALAKRQQEDAFPSILARQFAIPLGGASDVTQAYVRNPGITTSYPLRPEGVLRVVDYSPLTLERTPWVDPDLIDESRLVIHQTLELERDRREFRNLGIPGAHAYDVLFAVDSLTCFTAKSGRPNLFFETVLRPAVTTIDTSTVLEQAARNTPQLTSIWLGFAEILDAASRGTDVVAYDADTFAGYLGEIVSVVADSIGSRVILATIPHLRDLPEFTTPPPLALLGEEGSRASPDQPGGMLLDDGDVVPATALPWIRHGHGISDAALIARIAADEGVDPVTARERLDDRYPGHGRPLPASLTLTAAELGSLEATVDAYNAAITALAVDRDLPLVRLDQVFADLFAGRYGWGGVTLDGTFVFGGAFSLDGVHPTSFGQAVIANAFIEVLNDAFDAAVPPVGLGRFVDLVDPLRVGAAPRTSPLDHAGG